MVHPISFLLSLQWPVPKVATSASLSALFSVSFSGMETAKDLKLLLGAGVFVTTVVAGTICFVTPFRSIQRPLLRDIIFFLVAAFAAYLAMYDGVIYAAESIGFIIMYVVYLVILIGGYFINRRIKDRRALLQATTTEAAAKTYGSIQTAAPSSQAAVSVDDPEQNNIDGENYAQPDVTFALALRHAFLPREEVPWAEKGLFNKVVTVLKVRKRQSTIDVGCFRTVFQMPVSLILHFTVPLVDYEEPEHNWNKLLNSFHLLSGPVAISLLTQGEWILFERCSQCVRPLPFV